MPLNKETKLLEKILKQKLYLPRQKWTMNKVLIFFKISQFINYLHLFKILNCWNLYSNKFSWKKYKEILKPRNTTVEF